MKKRTALCTFAMTACLAIAPMAMAKDLALAYFMGPKHPMNGAVFTPFAQKLAEVSDGALTVTQFPGGALNSAPSKQYSILRDGVADIAFHPPGYTATLFPVTTSITTPGLCLDAVECTEALWRAYDVVEKEFDAKILALWANDPHVIFSKDKPIRTLEDMSGLIVRMSSAQDIPFMEALGGSAVSQPVSVINQNLSNGVIDAIAIDASANMSFKLDEPANYITTNVPGSVTSFALLMNQGVYDALSDEEKAWVAEASGKELSLQGAQVYHDLAIRGVEIARQNGVEIITLADDERARWDAAIEPALDAWKASDVGQGLTGAQVMQLMQGE
ncbi:C4-dicarboxylate ABC transporter [Amylibacter ulvae]|uniref:C4-dicarboxylate ABC transporter n=1 Tax=Paramylibacter ulvae TaxID=1651968 RepID=A0ABQ3D6N4_9RHOB|nr:TRAP transporter substrate-binding protein [Amylibacter ulvae]GHA61616.1 C4-dicarboxylate ABC transporter [Amylibacter ulvae]